MARADLDDVVQDALLELLRLIENGTPLHRGYVIGVTRNIALAHRRRNPRCEALVTEAASESRASIGGMLRDRLEHLVDALSRRLTQRDRRVVQAVTECATLSEVARCVKLDRRQVRRSLDRFVGLAREFLSQAEHLEVGGP